MRTRRELKFRYTKVAGQRTLSLTPEKVPGMLRAMQKRATWEGVIISPDEKPGPDGAGQFPILSLSAGIQVSATKRIAWS